MLSGKHQSQVGVVMHITSRPAGRWRQEGWELTVYLSHSESLRPVWATGRTVSKQIQEPTTTNPNIVQTEKLKWFASWLRITHTRKTPSNYNYFSINNRLFMSTFQFHKKCLCVCFLTMRPLC